MKRYLLTIVGLFAIAIIFYSINFPVSNGTSKFTESIDEKIGDDPKFRYLFGSFGGDHATYTFQTPPEEKTLARDCIGCEVGNAVIFAEFGCLKHSENLFKSNSKNGVEERKSIADSKGQIVGESRLIVFKDKAKNKVSSARLIWIEGNDFWAVQALTVELTKALRESEQYKQIREKVLEEINNYVPILNANTIGKSPCELRGYKNA